MVKLNVNDHYDGGNNSTESDSKAPYVIPGSDFSKETFTTLANDFHSRFLKTNSVLLKASLNRLGIPRRLQIGNGTLQVARMDSQGHVQSPSSATCWNHF